MKTLPLGQTWNGIEKRFHYDEDSFVIEQVSDAAKAIQSAKELRDRGVNKKAQGRVAAQIDPVVYTVWMKEFEKSRGYKYAHAPMEERYAFIAQKLNNRDFSKFRAWEGKL